MERLKLKQDMLKGFLEAISTDSALLTPQKIAGETVFCEWDGDLTFLQWYHNTTKGIKLLFFPLYEEIFQFKKEKNIHTLIPSPLNPEPKILFGVRACDARALTIVDKLFFDTYEDPTYKNMRTHTTLIGLGCMEHDDACFCESLKVDPICSQDVDIMINDIGDSYVVDVITEKGKNLISLFSGFSELTDDDHKTFEKIRESVLKGFSKEINLDNLSERMRNNFDNEQFWEKVSQKCISCGICTLLCPTCHCFDLCDEKVKSGGRRLRCYDSCAFELFTKMPMENPRHYKWQRVRQKVHHKFEYYVMNYDVIACVGCGRCVRLCPVNWDIAETINRI
ncbi:MAG: 4Fe-4S dicluster domain-containing protein [Thermodesulfobacteriota bacterium]|nr:4Fe-4S dicluster domain-containing protein [Thermodesulfobacteriota bacterium]